MRPVATQLRRDDFESFVRTAFAFVHGQNLGSEQYITLLCDRVGRLESVPDWLVVNLPPQHLKTFIVSVCFPVWVIGRQPATKFMIVANNDDLGRLIADLIGAIVEADWFKEVFPLSRVHDNRARRLDFSTTKNGGIFIATFGHSITGRGADFLIIDDPVDLAKIEDHQIDRANTIIATKYLSRLSVGARSRFILVHQRVHPNDAAAFVLSNYPDAKHISLSLVAKEDEEIPPSFRRKAGEALRPDIWTPSYIERMRALVGHARFETIYMQDPSGGIAGCITPLNFPRFTGAPTSGEIVISVDAAKRSEPQSSFTAMLVFARANNFSYLVSASRGRWRYRELRDILRELVRRWRPVAILIEDAAHGTTLLQEAIFRKQAIAINPGSQPKADRLFENLPAILSGHVQVLDDATGQAFIEEVVAFPFGHNDDQVDALTQYLSWAKVNPSQNRPQLQSSVAGVIASRGFGQHGPYTPLPPDHMGPRAGSGRIGLGAIASLGRWPNRR